MTNKSIALATSVAALLLAAGCSSDSGDDTGTKTQKASVTCYGANECKGMGACQGAGHDCAGKNDCKGMGFIEVDTEQACTDAGGSLTG